VNSRHFIWIWALFWSVERLSMLYHTTTPLIASNLLEIGCRFATLTVHLKFEWVSKGLDGFGGLFVWSGTRLQQRV